MRSRDLRAWVLAWTAALTLGGGSALADDPLYRPVTSGPFLAFTAQLPPPRRILVQPILSFTRFEQAEVGRSFDSVAVFTEYGLSRRFSIGGQAQVTSHSATSGDDSAGAVALADTHLFGRASLWMEQPDAPWPEIVGLAQLKLPTGLPPPGTDSRLHTDVTGTGTVDFTLGLNLTKGVRPLLLHLDLLGTYGVVATTRTSYGPTFGWSFAAELPVAAPWALMAELSGRHRPFAGAEDSPIAAALEHEVSLGVGVELISRSDVQALVGVQRTMWGLNVPVATSVIATIVPTF